MDEQSEAEFERRVEERAEKLWREAGSPQGGMETYRDRARELVAIQTDPDATTKPVESPSDPDAEPLIAIENQGEFPNLTDQGEHRDRPLPRGERQKDRE